FRAGLRVEDEIAAANFKRREPPLGRRRPPRLNLLRLGDRTPDLLAPGVDPDGTLDGVALPNLGPVTEQRPDRRTRVWEIRTLDIRLQISQSFIPTFSGDALAHGRFIVVQGVKAADADGEARAAR